MIVKKQFELITTKAGAVHNIVPIPKSTLAAFKVDKDDYNHLMGQISIFTKYRPHITSNIVNKYLNKCQIVRMEDYPLPGFVSELGEPVINLSAMSTTTGVDYNQFDIYSMAIYAISLYLYTSKKNIRSDNIIIVSSMIFSIFMRLYGKKSGLIGSYSYLIPKLRFLIELYVSCSMFGSEPSEKLKQKIANSLYLKYTDLKLDFDFTSVSGFLTSINENSVISLSQHTFSSLMINRGGVVSLPIFEDISRFFATIMATSVYGTSVFAIPFSKFNKSLYPKLLSVGMSYLK